MPWLLQRQNERRECRIQWTTCKSITINWQMPSLGEKNRPGPQLIQDNPSSDASGSSDIVVDNNAEQPTLQSPTIEPQDASAGEMHVQHEMNSSLNMHLLALDQLYGGESLCRRQSLIEQCCSPATSAGISLGATVPLRIKQKNCATKFVDMHTLLPDFQEDKLSLQVEQGSITVASQRGKKNPYPYISGRICISLS